MSTNTVTPALGLIPPHGLDQILATFGDIFDYIGPDHTLNPRWQNEFLQRIALPFPLTLAWDKSRRVNQLTCHKRFAEIFTATLVGIQTAGLQDKISSLGGCFSFRPQRTGAKLSAHSWGHRNRSEYRIECAGHRWKYGSSYCRNFPQRRFRVGRRVARQIARPNALPIMHRILGLLPRKYEQYHLSSWSEAKDPCSWPRRYIGLSLRSR